MLRTGILAFANDPGFYRLLAVGTSAKAAVYPVDLERSADAVFPFPCVDWLKTVLSAVFCGVHVAVRSLFRLDAYPNLMSVKGCLLCLFGAFVPSIVCKGIACDRILHIGNITEQNRNPAIVILGRTRIIAGSGFIRTVRIVNTQSRIFR